MAIKNRVLQTVWHVVKNKYVACIILFVVFMCISENNIFVTMRLQAELNELRSEQKGLRSELQHDSTHLKVLQGDLEAMERYGREVYYLRAEDEDVYVFE